jgi:MerR family redox-sensitive transcriptional activator SoxR
MATLTISEAARRLGIRSSTIRYYEEIGILPPPHRFNGQRRYDEKVLYRLAVIQHAQRAGFSLPEIRKLFFGFRNEARPSERWKKLASKKLAELDEMMQQIETMRSLLLKSCDCAALDECGSKILRKQCGDA